MKKIFIGMLSILIAHVAYSQSTPATAVAEKIAQKMKDSLTLSDSQKEQIYQVNMQLHNQKMLVRQNHTVTDSVRSHTQYAENTRDSLYRAVLPEGKYLMYLQKKRNLVSNN